MASMRRSSSSGLGGLRVPKNTESPRFMSTGSFDNPTASGVMLSAISTSEGSLHMTKASANHGQLHPHDRALKVALDRSLDLAKVEHGISASWVAEYILKIHPGTLSKYRNVEEPDLLPTRFYPLVAVGTGNTVLMDALASLCEHHGAPSPVPSLASIMATRTGKAMALLFQALQPDSPGGATLVASERADLHPEILRLQQVVDELVEATR